jgi:AraC-like DNA-binding protein
LVSDVLGLQILRLANQVEQVLIELHKEGMNLPSLEVIAGILSMSTRHCPENLGEKKEKYQNIKSKVRCDMAKKYLLNSDVPVTHIAAKVPLLVKLPCIKK